MNKSSTKHLLGNWKYSRRGCMIPIYRDRCAPMEILNLLYICRMKVCDHRHSSSTPHTHTHSRMKSPSRDMCVCVWDIGANIRFWHSDTERVRETGRGRAQTWIKRRLLRANSHTPSSCDECTLRKRIPKRIKKTCFETSFHYGLKECLRSSAVVAA